MDKEMEIISLLQSQQIEFRERGNELIAHCLFSDCDSDSRGNEAHLYINKLTGAYMCHKCGNKGSIWGLKKHFGIELPVKRTPITQSPQKLAEKCHINLPKNIREYLVNDRLIHPDEIDDRMLGYLEDPSGLKWLTIPVFDPQGNVLFMKLRQDPFNPSSGSKYKSSGGDSAVYNVQTLKDKPETLVICEGEYDCMVLASLGIPAVCSTAGALTFKQEWIDKLSFVREFYVVMDNDEAGRKGAEALIEKLHTAHPQASILNVTLPSSVGDHGDITDYFKLKLGEIEDLFEASGKYVTLVAGEEPIDPTQFKEISLNEVADVLSLTIKHDKENKLITFLCCLSAYTHSDQLNVSFNAPSSSGKSYMTKEIAMLFPESDKIELSGASPTSFYHGEGVYDKERGAKIVSLSRKILIFYEQPDPQLQEKLRSVLSHDSWEIKHRITNKDKKGAHRAELIIIEGFPATIFCSASLRLDEQEATRAILLSPEVTEDKLSEGVHLQAQRGANSSKFNVWLDSQTERAELKDRILAIKREGVDNIVIDDIDTIAIEARFKSALNGVKPRHMRDMGHLMKLIKTIALLNVWSRRQPDGTIIASKTDIDQAFDLWGHFIESQNLNISPAATSFYKQYIIPAFKEKKAKSNFAEAMENGIVGISRQEVCNFYYRKEQSPVNDDYLRKQIIPQLENSSLITQEKPSEGDKRSRHIFPQWFPDENNIGLASGETKNNDTIIDPFDH